MNKAREILEKIIRFMFDSTLLIASVAILITPAGLPFLIDFHPLLVVPYYGILWWSAALNYISRKDLESRMTNLLANEASWWKEEEK
jgi:hypothetical protein